MGRGGNGQAVRARTRDGAAARDQRARAVSESMNWDGWTKEGCICVEPKVVRDAQGSSVAG